MSTGTVTDHARRYWRYEYDVSWRYMIPLLRRWQIPPDGRTLLDAGCGEGGGVCAMHDAGAICAGFDNDAGRIEIAATLKGNRAIPFAVGNLYDDRFPFDEDRYSFIILHDVFEHLERKEHILKRLAGLLTPDGRLLLTFPPYYSAFGAHQQQLSAPLARTPFVHLLPFAISRVLPRIRGEAPTVVEEIQKLSRLKMGMGKFESIVRQSGLRIIHRQAYLISPNHIRFGLTPLPAGPLGSVPLIRELCCSGVVYLIGR
jgi:SAM-dependent methyltransferase